MKKQLIAWDKNKGINAKSHRYWCEDCESPFRSYERKCPECGETSEDIVLINEMEIKPRAKRDLSICESCGKKMVDNTFKSGSRIGGSYDCECGNKIIF